MDRISRLVISMVFLVGFFRWGTTFPLHAQTFTEVGSNARVESTARGAAWGDYDNDGDLDLYLARRAQAPNLLYQNNGDGTFAETGERVGMNDLGNGFVSVWGDYDNDGDLDLYQTNSSISGEDGVNRLYRNKGDGTFTEVGASAGVDARGDSRGTAWGDYDNDGNLDLYVTDFLRADHLYRNNGDETFTDIGASVGVIDNEVGRGTAWGDYDNDGDLDLYVANQLSANLLYWNNGDGTFTEVAESAGIDDRDSASLGPTWGDYAAIPARRISVMFESSFLPESLVLTYR